LVLVGKSSVVIERRYTTAPTTMLLRSCNCRTVQLRRFEAWYHQLPWAALVERGRRY
jgi:hypothetical protein